MKHVSVTNVVAVLVALAVGRCTAESGVRTVTVTEVDTVAPQALLDMLEAGALENSGLKAKLAGHARVEPVYIVRTDTLVTPPDTVLQLVAFDGEGSLTLAPLIHGDSLWAPELHRFDIGDCDDGWSWSAGEVVCDRARFGHLTLIASAGVAAPLMNLTGSYPSYRAYLGAEWVPNNRSPWRASVELDRHGVVSAAVSRRLSLF